eukprot:TRINITY_DN3378_c0_g1_i1.p1 TRINITY_DN3378_c0_g1~~TRINITY_DN3378_c0_g1_i1.p1  ORF type:complete len:497 (+),score=100.63 TRINITY_DN3378_c0_g1_i1:191-1492(+)
MDLPAGRKRDRNYSIATEGLSLSVDTMLLRGSLTSGIFLYQGAEDGDLVIIYSLEDLPRGVDFFTENKNKVVRISDGEVALISPQGSENVTIPIPRGNLTVEPVLLDRHADESIASTAEATIEELSGETLYSGIAVFNPGEESGRIIFSLKELPVGIPFTTTSGHMIKRHDNDEFKIDNKMYEPAKETQLLSGKAVTSSTSPSKAMLSGLKTVIINKDHLRKSLETVDLGSVSSSSLPKMESTSLEKENAREAWIAQFSLEQYEKKLESAKIKRREEKENRVRLMIGRYAQYYSKPTISMAPLGDNIDVGDQGSILMRSEYVKELRTKVSESKKYETRIRVAAEMEPYSDQSDHSDSDIALSDRSPGSPRLSPLSPSQLRMSTLASEIRTVVDVPSPRGSPTRTFGDSPPRSRSLEPIQLHFDDVPEECFSID